MKFKHEKTPNAILWDANRDNVLCKFSDGFFETEDEKIIRKLEKVENVVVIDPMAEMEAKKRDELNRKENSELKKMIELKDKEIDSLKDQLSKTNALLTNAKTETK